MKKRILTYGTFDLFHVGHVRILERAQQLGDELIVGVSTDQFNSEKGKKCIMSYEQRAEIVGALRCVTTVLPENSWAQKRTDIQKYNIDIFVMGADWTGEFDNLRDLCEVNYFPRTENVSTTAIKKSLTALKGKSIEELKDALDIVQEIVQKIS